MSILTPLCRAFAALLSALLVLSLVLMFLAVGVQVIARGLFQTSVLWLDDMLMAGFTVSIFCGIALAFRARSHLATTVIPDSLPPRAARAYGRVIDAVSALAMAGIGWFGIDFVQGAFGQYSPVLRLPMGWVYLIIPVSAVVSILFIIENQLTTTDNVYD